MHSNLANVSGQQSQVTGKFNGWASDLLLLHFEELRNDNYRNKDFETLIKQFSTPKGNRERKYKDSGADEEHNAIVGLKTNSPDPHGIIRGDEALISRVVLLDFKPNPKELDWKKEERKLLLHDDTHESDIGFMLYQYSKEPL